MFHTEHGGCLGTVNTVNGKLWKLNENGIEIVHNTQNEKLYIMHYFCVFLQKDIDILI